MRRLRGEAGDLKVGQAVSSNPKHGYIVTINERDGLMCFISKVSLPVVLSSFPT